MIIKPKIFRKLVWTQHSEIKMKQYGLSKSKLSNILRNPERKEQGIVPSTTAVMKTNKIINSKLVPLFKEKPQPAFVKTTAWRRKAPGEIWLMYKDVKDFRKIISAWRYPGISKPGEEIPVPEDIRQELLENGDE